MAANITDVFPEGRWDGTAERPILYFCLNEGAELPGELNGTYDIGGKLYRLTDFLVTIDVELDAHGSDYFNPTGLQRVTLTFERLPLGATCMDISSVARRIYDMVRGYR